MSDHPLRILVVDDDAVDRMAVRRALRAREMEGETTEARSVEGALAALASQRFDCVFLDFQLPGGDGMRVLRETRAAGNRVPIIVLTGQQDEEVAVELMKAGASDYIPKAKLAPDRLEQSVRSALRVHRAEGQAQEAQEALRRSEERYRLAMRATDDAIWDWDLAAGRMTWNDAIERVFGYENDPAGRPAEAWHDFIHPEDRPRVQAGLQGVVHGDTERWSDEYRFRRRDGGYAHVLDRAYVLRDESGRPLRMIGSMSDITRRRLAEEERERLVAARSRFYAAMSHEIRTPINAVLGYTDLLLLGAYGPLDAKQLGGIERVHRAGQHLLELVNDVLDLSKLEAGKLEIQLEPVRVPELIVDLLTTVQPLAEEHGSALELIDDRCADTIVSDPRRIRQILLNLLSNALKFGRSRPVTVRCGRSGERVFIEVVDRGAGIPSAELPRIFEEFVQLPSAQDRGTGLGLPISRGLAELLGGELQAESREGEGSTFRLLLPARAPAG